MKTGTKVLMGVGAAGAAFAICCKWGSCCSCMANGNGDYLLPTAPPPDPPMINPTDNIGTAGPTTPSPTDFTNARTNVPSMLSFSPPREFLIE